MAIGGLAQGLFASYEAPPPLKGQTVRSLKLFNLPRLFIPFAEKPIPDCPQPAEDFDLRINKTTVLRIAPATLPWSTYVPMNLERAMRWQWRIREWKVTIDAEYQNEPMGGSFLVPNVFGEAASGGELTEMRREVEKICRDPRFGGGEFYNRVANGDVSNPFGEWTILDVAIGSADVAWANYPDEPRQFFRASQGLRVSADKKTFYIPVFLEFEAGSDDNRFFNGTLGSGQTEANDLGLIWTIYDGIAAYSKPFQIGDDSVTGEIRIEANSYWPYDPGDGGGPIYNEKTGEQRRPLPNF
jgi:hypothetical protein